jgi:hypothetical protein
LTVTFPIKNSARAGESRLMAKMFVPIVVACKSIFFANLKVDKNQLNEDYSRMN